jgi:endonuclease/exonuclease/phosphatase family metal-dependent hydrolase
MRLATFNILHGRSMRDGVVDPGRLAEAVRRLDPDILALQEVDRDQPRSHHTDLTAIAAEAMGAVTHRFAAALTGNPGGAWLAASENQIPGSAAYGIALLSRYPALSWQVGHLPRIPFRFPLYLRQPRKMIVVHEEPRAVVTGQFDTPLGPLVVVNTHLTFVPGWSQLQLRQIRRSLEGVDDPVVLMGDLNMAGSLPARLTGYRSLASHPTFPLADPDRQLDHILARGVLGRVRSTESPELPLSDHRALLVDLDKS